MNYVAIAIILVILILWISSRRGGPIRHLRKTIKRAIKRKNKSDSHYLRDKLRPQFIAKRHPQDPTDPDDPWNPDEPDLSNPPACINKVSDPQNPSSYTWERVAATYDKESESWKCDFFDLGNKRFPDPDATQQAGDPHVLCLAQDQHNHEDPTQACGWGTFATSSLKPYDIGGDADGLVSGYRLMPMREDQPDNLFKRFTNIDATGAFNVKNADVLNLTATDVDECEARCVEPYDYINGSSNALGCYGYVYDPTTTNCDVFRTNNPQFAPNNKQLRMMM